MIRPVRNIEEAIVDIKAFPAFKNIIVDLLAEDCIEFTRKVYKAKLMSAYYHYHFTTMVSVVW